MNSEITKVKTVVHSAMLRMLRARCSPSSRISRIRNAPTSGRNVTVREDRPVGHQMLLPNIIQVTRRGDADQHGEGIVVEIAGLQLDHAVGDVDHARRNAVRAEARR